MIPNPGAPRASTYFDADEVLQTPDTTDSLQAIVTHATDAIATHTASVADPSPLIGGFNFLMSIALIYVAVSLTSIIFGRR